VGDWLRAAGAGVEVREEPPDSLAGYDGVVVLGGSQSANDAELEPVRAMLRDAVTAEVPTLAICLGAQLLAVAHGGRVEADADRAEFGAQLIAKRTAASTDPLFGSRPITPDVIQWHFDAITTLPAGAVQLASSPVCANQAFRLGRLAWGIQFHIETTPEVVRDWARSDATVLAELDLDFMVSRTDAAHDDVAEVWAPFVHDFVAIADDPASVPVARGVPTSTAEPVTDPAAIRAALAAEADAARQPLPMPSARQDD
jgi:GMP synthase-like glutamine amidotransferase